MRAGSALGETQVCGGYSGLATVRSLALFTGCQLELRRRRQLERATEHAREQQQQLLLEQVCCHCRCRGCRRCCDDGCLPNSQANNEHAVAVAKQSQRRLEQQLTEAQDKLRDVSEQLTQEKVGESPPTPAPPPQETPPPAHRLAGSKCRRSWIARYPTANSTPATGRLHSCQPIGQSGCC